MIMPFKLKGTNVVVIILIIIFFSATYFTKNFEPSTPSFSEDWQNEYQEMLLTEGISEDLNNNGINDYIEEQSTIDYSRPEVQEAINEILPKVSNPEEAVRKTLNYVLKNIRYNPIEINYCLAETGSYALRQGIGDCVSMTKASASILRGMGLAVRTGGGCLKSFAGCSSIMGTLPIPITRNPPVEQDGLFKKTGFLHEWAYVWIPGKDWVLIDSTNGAVYETDCIDYDFYDYDYGQKFDMCVIKDREYVTYCAEV